MLKRAVDIVGAGLGLVLLSPVFVILFLAVRAETPGPSLHWSRRVGRGNVIFRMPKFRSMRVETPDVATHLLADPNRWVTPFGRFLRRSSLDELPQLWSILMGQMSLVGPRPALFNQDDLISLRTEAGVDRLRPGLTGWAQVNGRDELPIPEKARLDAEYLARHSIGMDFLILAKTAVLTLSGRGIGH